MIPLLLHQIWIGGTTPPPDLLSSHRHCSEINKEFQPILWNDGNVTDFLSLHYPEVYTVYRRGVSFNANNHKDMVVRRSDIARYAILHHYGGVYLDMDFTCVRSLLPFTHYPFFYTEFGWVTTWMQSRRTPNGMFGSVAGHPILTKALSYILRDRIIETWKGTGTRMFHRAITESGAKDAVLVDRKYLHPCEAYEIRALCDTEDSYIIHQGMESGKSLQQTLLWILLPAAILYSHFVVLLLVFARGAHLLRRKRVDRID